MSSYYPQSAVSRLMQRGSGAWVNFITHIMRSDPTSREVVAFTTTMRYLRDSNGLDEWLLTDAYNAMDINFILDCIGGQEERIFEVYNYVYEHPTQAIYIA